MPTLLGLAIKWTNFHKDCSLCFSCLCLWAMLLGRNNVSVVLSDNCQSCKAHASLLFSSFCLCLFCGRRLYVPGVSRKMNCLSSLCFPLRNQQPTCLLKMNLCCFLQEAASSQGPAEKLPSEPVEEFAG